MIKRCNKYKPLYIFRSEEEFFQHLDNCAYCQNKYDDMMQVEELVRSAKPLYSKRKNFKDKLFQLKYKIAASIVILAIAAIGINNYYESNYISIESDWEIAEVTSGSIFNQMNLPTDEYGILSIDKDFTYDK